MEMTEGKEEKNLEETAKTEGKNFIQHFIDGDLAEGKIRPGPCRFPRSNGYLHIGHAKAICLNFGLALANGGKCNLRFDDTNPTKEEQEFVDSIKADVEWLGFHWDHLFFASDYFEKLYLLAEKLVTIGKAYVCDLSPEEIHQYRGALTEPGKESPYRDRSPEENLDLLRKMKAGEFPDGSRVLRAKIDMASPNLNMRDPVLYRIQRAHHHRTGDGWCIYPMYDFAHPLSDAIEGITHSICTMEFEDHRPLYDWCINAADMPCKSRQIEFARLNMSYTVMSKRKLKLLVEEGYVQGWDDPRLPTLSGIRRRGYPAESIRAFCESIGVAKANSTVDIAQLEFFVRDHLNYHAPRAMAVLDPLKVTITNYPEGQEEMMQVVNNPEDSEAGTRPVPFSRQILIEKSDFMEQPTKKFHRLSPGAEIRLQNAYYIKCEDYKKDENGEVVELFCTYDPSTRGGWSEDGRKVKGTAHWLSYPHAVKGEVRLYNRLFSVENPDDYPEGGSFLDHINPQSVEVVEAYLEPSLAEVKPGDRFQFLRQGYFVADPDGALGRPVFNRIISLKDSFKKIMK